MTEPTDRPLAVLLVDDDEDDYFLTRELLYDVSGVRFDVEWAATPEAALRRIECHGLDVVLVDYLLGATDGLELVREVIGRGIQTPMILLTGQGDREVDLKAMRAGAADYLVKGQLSPALLERTIRYAMERARGEETLRRAYRELSEANERLTREIAERERAEAELAHRAFHDPLTGLPNRALFMDCVKQALSRARRADCGIGVIFLDLDNFKVVNDSLGHEAGDEFLVRVAERLRASVRAVDMVARLGGDEFTVLLEDVADEAGALLVVERLAEQLRRPMEIRGRRLFTDASIGLALGAPNRDRAEDLLRNADLAMYRAKAAGKGRSAVFDPSMNVEAQERLELETDLRGAIGRGELRLAYQPIVSLQTGRIDALEALARWEHPRLGQIPPAKFIGIAEEIGLIVPLGHWVLTEACRQARSWQLAFPMHPPLGISVNLSARQFSAVDLVTDVERVLRETELDPACLQLEITESTIMVSTGLAGATLRALKNLGLRLAIDDFGTGYSSLSYLRDLPIDTLKIDRSFVGGLGTRTEDAAIIRGIVALSEALNLSVTAEGIETVEQFELLRSIRCHQGQGYYLARPSQAEALTPLLAERVRLNTHAA